MIRGNGRDIVGDFSNVPAHLGTVDYEDFLLNQVPRIPLSITSGSSAHRDRLPMFEVTRSIAEILLEESTMTEAGAGTSHSSSLALKSDSS